MLVRLAVAQAQALVVLDPVGGPLRQRWAAGAAGLRTVRVRPPDGGVELVDFAMEEKRAARALLAVERATRERDNKIDAVTTTWER